MRCRYCEGDTRVISTRTRGEFYVVRRQECLVDQRHRFNTVELLETVVKKVAASRMNLLLDISRRGAARNRVAYSRRTRALQLITEGVKYEVIAAELGVSLASVRKYAREGIQAGELNVRRGGHGRATRVPAEGAPVLHLHDAGDPLLEGRRNVRPLAKDLR